MKDLDHIEQRRPSGWRRVVAAVVLLIAAIGLLALALKHPGEYSNLPPCPSWAVGVTCPGCGSMRATHYLLNADLAQAWRHNPALLILGVPAIAIIAIQCVRVVAGRQPLPIRWASAWLGWSVVVLVVAYFAMRNIPSWEWLRPPT